MRILSKLKGEEVTEDKLKANAYAIVVEQASMEFKIILLEGKDKDSRIDLVQQVKQNAETVSKRHMNGVDTFNHALNGQDGVYTSKHYIYANKVIKAWRAKIKQIKEDRASGVLKSKPTGPMCFNMENLRQTLALEAAEELKNEGKPKNELLNDEDAA